MSIKETIRAEIERKLKIAEFQAQKTAEENNYEAHLQWDQQVAVCNELLRFLDTLPEQPVGKTCKTCGFYENNCPFIRGKFIPYPNKVCKDYTYSAMKAQEQPASEELYEEVNRYYSDNFAYLTSDQPTLSIISNIARHFAEWGAEHLKR